MKLYHHCYQSGNLYGTAHDGIPASLLDSVFEAFFRGVDCFCDGDYLYKMYFFPRGSMRGVKVVRILLRFSDKPSFWLYESFWQAVFSGYYMEMGGTNYVS